ncbi:PREDICTED: peroxisomal 2,4-dienoyl-CoA reductase [Colobus angolensis palliatus]|uniref:Peroxisomal 2,4-dienoyl-CoA reductase [(3E)-enoyl-CoA-producing] n=1 Tax=Colobus angolensis palliatus TaxID=336983 RepID=A0A2K5IJL9_COLAP|nr:PREDICTED: peroxisomal 2,4-dienoyl-CoA reductase [Colobus angolensis palliatus]
MRTGAQRLRARLDPGARGIPQVPQAPKVALTPNTCEKDSGRGHAERRTSAAGTAPHAPHCACASGADFQSQRLRARLDPGARGIPQGSSNGASFFTLRDKVAFITGGGSGIGFRIAEIFMRHGCHTVIASRSLPRVLMAARKLAGATGRRCLPLCMDVRAPPAVMAAVDQALKEFGRIDILINCAAGNFLCPAGALSFNAFKTVMDIDTSGTFNVSRVLYEKFFRDHGGVIVNITATLGNRGQALQVHAGSAKAAVDAMTRHLAVEWGPQNIRVNSLAPGPISGTEGLRRLGGPQASLSTKVTVSPLQRLGNKTEIAHSVLYLASPLASYVTGAVLVADGGAWLTFPNDVKGLADFASFSSKL